MKQPPPPVGSAIKFIVELALEKDPFIIASALWKAHPTATISVVDQTITITKINPVTHKEETTGWNPVASDPNTNAVMIASALTSAEIWMKLFPTLLTELSKAWKIKSKKK